MSVNRHRGVGPSRMLLYQFVILKKRMFFGPQVKPPEWGLRSRISQGRQDFQDYTTYRFHVKPKIGKSLACQLQHEADRKQNVDL